jgi:pimeloyl-ACP methyl ester carboxylesterase
MLGGFTMTWSATLGLVLGRKWLWIVLASLGVLYTTAAAIMYVGQDEMIFPGTHLPPPRNPGPTEPGVQQIWITADDGSRVEAWFKPGRGRTAASPGPAVIYFHGNYATVDDCGWLAPMYASDGISALVVEFRGYGRAGGRPSQQAIVADSLRFYDWLAARPEVDPHRIILQGMSLGGAVAAQIADQRPAAGLILECTFTSLEAMTHRYLMPGFLCRHPFHTDRILPKLNIPIIIFHGRDDRTVPVEHGRRLHELAPRSRYVELPCGHQNYSNDFANIRVFLAETGLLPSR